MGVSWVGGLGLVALGAFVGCGSTRFTTVSTDGGATFEGGDSTVTAEGGSSACPDGRGPYMVRTDNFCIDREEVTNRQYNDFVLSGETPPQPPECAWNTVFVPGDNLPYDPNKADYPVANVDWCDAHAFCEWAGKHLCGKIDGGPANVTNPGAIDDEHYYACSLRGNRLFPYGNTFMSGLCNLADLDAGGPLPVALFSTCVGGFPGVYNLIGNVEEWQDACNAATGPNDQCVDGPGSYAFGAPSQTQCDSVDTDLRSSQSPDRGFRCCSP